MWGLGTKLSSFSGNQNSLLSSEPVFFLFLKNYSYMVYKLPKRNIFILLFLKIISLNRNTSLPGLQESDILKQGPDLWVKHPGAGGISCILLLQDSAPIKSWITISLASLILSGNCTVMISPSQRKPNNNNRMFQLTNTSILLCQVT